MFSTSQMLRILDVVGQRPFGPWPQINFQNEYARKRSIRIEIDLC